MSLTQKAPSEVTLGTKPPLSHRFGGFVPLRCLVEALSLCSGGLCVFFPGSYFANHFIMGGEKFDSTHPEGYLFGENSDLNFLGNRPVVVGTGVCGAGRGGGSVGLGGPRGAQGAPSQNGGASVCHGGAWHEAAGCHHPRAEPPKRTWGGLSRFSDV